VLIIVVEQLGEGVGGWNIDFGDRRWRYEGKWSRLRWYIAFRFWRGKVDGTPEDTGQWRST
jgi:hypothetical protein